MPDTRGKMLEHPAVHLTDNYRKDEEGNNYKLLELSHLEHVEIWETLKLMEAWRDMDLASGFTLDKIGKNVLELREGRNDEDFRKAIKIKIRGNLSAGLVEDLNVIAEILFEDNFINVAETWHQELFGYEPAAVSLSIVNITPEQQRNWGYIRNILDHMVRAGGVRLFWDLFWRVGSVIEVVVRVTFRPFRAPLTDTELSGTFPHRVYEGNVSRGGIEVGTDTGAFVFRSDDAGTKPYEVFTPSINRSDVEVHTRHRGQKFESPLTDAEFTGTYPERVYHGSAVRGRVEAAPGVTARKFDSDISGKKPHDVYMPQLNASEIAAKTRLKGYEFDSDTTGTKPDKAHKPSILRGDIDIESHGKAHKYRADETSTLPRDLFQGGITAAELQAQTRFEVAAFEADTSGTKPHIKTHGKPGRDLISPKVTVKGVEFHIRFCGTKKMGGS